MQAGSWGRPTLGKKQYLHNQLTTLPERIAWSACVKDLDLVSGRGFCCYLLLLLPPGETSQPMAGIRLREQHTLDWPSVSKVVTERAQTTSQVFLGSPSDGGRGFSKGDRDSRRTQHQTNRSRTDVESFFFLVLSWELKIEATVYIAQRMMNCQFF